MNIYFLYGSQDFLSNVERTSFINYYRDFQFIEITN